jgi:hypothetical protein
MIAAVSAGLLFIFMFLPWLGFDVPQGTVLEGVDDTVNAWQGTQSLDIFLFIVILSAIIPALLAMSGSVAQLPFVGATTTFLLAVLALILLLALIVDPGEAFGLSLKIKIGLWLSVLATGGIAVGGYLAMQDEAYGGSAPAPIDEY